MKCWSGRLLVALLVSGGIGGAAHADMITPWTYSVTRTPTSVAADTANNSTGVINLTLSPLAPGAHLNGDSDITVVSLTAFSSNSTGLDTFTNAPYSLAIQLTDLNSSATGELTFNGTFSGTLSTSSADIHTTFLDPTTQSIVLDQHKYTVSLNSFVPPGIQSDPTAGSIGAHVSITDVTGGGSTGGVQTVPEPATLLLASLALPAGLAWWRARGRAGRD
jgi:hypothetical protein